MSELQLWGVFILVSLLALGVKRYFELVDELEESS